MLNLQDKALIHFTKEKMMLPAQQAFNKPTFRFRPAIKAEMKEETLGRVF